mgnify:FL=1
MNGLSRKIYLELPLPTEDDPRSDQQRILDSLAAAGVEERVHMPVHILRKLYPLLDNAKWKITVSCLEWGKLGNGGDRGRRYHRAALWAGGGSGKYHCGGETSGLQQWRDFEGSQLLQ